MKQLLMSKGKVSVEEVPIPTLGSGEVLVKTKYSLISTGTELAGLQAKKKSLLRLALEKPEQVKKVVRSFKDEGWQRTYKKIKGQLGSWSPLGYSLAGEVVDVGDDVTDVHVADRVACAGASLANHAEFVAVPRNLVAKIPEGVSYREACSTTLGAIALQGVRRAEVRLGEKVAVIGLGLLGQLTVQILKSAGCQVVGYDLDRSRVEKAKTLGLDKGVDPEMDLVLEVSNFTADKGVDSTIITAATSSNMPVKQAMQITRKKGKVIVVGAVGMELERSPFYEKELDFLISTSYGPGRYDHNYEEKGIDYPYAYVRWTENRNMRAYLRLLDEGKINFEDLIEKEVEFEKAPAAYEELNQASSKPLAVVLRYSAEGQEAKTKVRTKLSKVKQTGKINVALIGAGSFAQGMHLPNLKKLSSYYNIAGIISKSGAKLKTLEEQYEPGFISTDHKDALEDPTVDLVMITTRHNLHTEMVIEALRAGKTVFVEKPLAINQLELDKIKKTLEETRGYVMTGFNRRFSPHAKFIKERLTGRSSPIMMLYRMNAGYLPADHWVHGEEGGGRIIGEGCHIFDLFAYFTESSPVDVQVSRIRPAGGKFLAEDNTIYTVTYKDGSVGSLLYTSMGNDRMNKEYMELFCEGKIFALEDYLNVRSFPGKGFSTKKQDKGHVQEMIELARFLKGEEEKPPIELKSQFETSEITFRQRE